MAEAEDKEKAKKLAAGKKRFEQLKKQRAKEAAGGKKPKEEEKEKDVSPTIDDTDEAEISKTDSKSTAPSANTLESVDAQSQSPPPVEPVRLPHGRQPSLSLQSRMRSNSFRRAASGANASSASGAVLSPLSPDGDAVQDIYRKQAARIEQLERDNKRLEKELADNMKLLQKSEAELEDLQEGDENIAELKSKAAQADSSYSEVAKLKAEISALQRKNSLLQTQATTKRRTSSSTAAPSLTDDLNTQLASKTNTIESLEVEISNLRHQLSTSASSTNTLTARIDSLEYSLQKAEQRADNATKELAGLKSSLESTSADAERKGSERSSAQTRIILLESDLSVAQQAASDAAARTDGYEKKIEALRQLHKESEARSQAQTAMRLTEMERLKTDAASMRSKLAFVSNANARMREASARERTTEAHGDGGGVEELEAEERDKLSARIRELEGQNYDLRRGVWKDGRRAMQPPVDAGDDEVVKSPGAFDDIDLSGPSPPTRRRSTPYSSVFQSAFNAFTGGERSRSSTQQSQPFLSDDDDMTFDENAFRAAQEKEANQRIERVKDLKRGLKQWESWRLDLVESRGGTMAGVFDV